MKVLAELIIILDYPLLQLLLYQPVTRLPQPQLEVIGVRVQLYRLFHGSRRDLIQQLEETLF